MIRIHAISNFLQVKHVNAFCSLVVKFTVRCVEDMVRIIIVINLDLLYSRHYS